MFGSNPLSGIRSSSSLGGYHAYTSPENFFKKKYKSAHLKKAQRRVVSGSLDRVPKSELYQQIMAQYRKGGIQRKKKTLRKRKHRRHRSKALKHEIYNFNKCFSRASKLPGIALECMGYLQQDLWYWRILEVPHHNPPPQARWPGLPSSD